MANSSQIIVENVNGALQSGERDVSMPLCVHTAGDAEKRPTKDICNKKSMHIISGYIGEGSVLEEIIGDECDISELLIEEVEPEESAIPLENPLPEESPIKELLTEQPLVLADSNHNDDPSALVLAEGRKVGHLAEAKKFLLHDNVLAEIVGLDENRNPIFRYSSAYNSDTARDYPVQCGICPLIFHRSALKEHRRTHREPSSKKFRCSICNLAWGSVLAAASHQRRHQDCRPHICLSCGMDFITKHDLGNHQLRRHHPPRFACMHCSKRFAQKSCLNRHLETHYRSKTFLCPECGKSYSRQTTLDQHIIKEHRGGCVIFECRVCGLHCKNSHDLAAHRRDVHSQESVECRQCGKVFESLSLHDSHRKSLKCRMQ